MTTPDVVDVVELPALVAEARFLFMQMASAMLASDVIVTDLPSVVIAKADALKANGWRIALELSADASGAATVLLVAISRDGVRRVLAPVAEAASAGVAN